MHNIDLYILWRPTIHICSLCHFSDQFDVLTLLVEPKSKFMNCHFIGVIFGVYYSFDFSPIINVDLDFNFSCPNRLYGFFSRLFWVDVGWFILGPMSTLRISNIDAWTRKHSNIILAIGGWGYYKSETKSETRMRCSLLNAWPGG